MKAKSVTDLENCVGRKQPTIIRLPTFRGSVQHVKYLVLGITCSLLLVFVVISCSILAAPQLAIAVLVALLILWLTIQRPWLALLFVFLGTGLPSLLLPIPGHTIRPAEMAIYLCVLLVFWLRPRMNWQVTHLFALLFLAVMLISFIHMPEFSTNKNVLGANKRVYNLALIFLAFFCGTLLVRSVRNISTFLTLVLLSNLPVYLISLAQTLSIQLPILLSPNQNPAATGDKGRLVGPFDGAATLGIYMAGLFAVAIACWLHGTQRRDRWIGALMTFATLLVIIGSGTRSALAATGVMLGLALIITRRYKLLWTLAIFVIGSFIAFPNIIVSHFTHASTSTTNRIFLWHEALKIIAAHPIIGIGLEQFHYYYQKLIISQSTQLNSHGISVHNQYLEWATESGIPWLILGVCFLVGLIVTCLRAYRFAAQEQRILLLATSLAFCAALITGCLDVPFDNVEIGMFLCLLAGLSIGNSTAIQQLKTNHRSTNQ